MKNLWSKTPAWLKAILLNIILLYPVLFINQSIIYLNLQFFPQWGVGLFLILGVLYFYWILVNRLNPFKDKKYIQLSLKFDISKTENLLSIAGLFLFTFSMISVGLIFLGAEPTQQLQVIQLFSNYSPQTSIPLLLGLALGAGLVEEVTYRAYMQNTTHQKYPRIISYVLLGILFALCHFLPWPLVPMYILVSMAYSVVTDQQKSIALGIFAHVFYDFVLFLLIYQGILSANTLSANSIFMILSPILLLISMYLILFHRKKALVYST